MKKTRKGAKILSILEILCSIGLIVNCIILLMLQNTVSFEKVSVFEKTPKSSLFVIMEHYPVLGCLFVVLGMFLAVVGIIRLFISMKKESSVALD